MIGGKYGFFMVCTIDSLDINAVRCNHQFFINFQNKNYSNLSGEYHILKSENKFIVGSNGHAFLQSKLYFKKQENNNTIV
jgi:hypothetical protein